MRPLIFDATPLIYPGKANLIEKIKHFPEDKYTTKSVYREVVEERETRSIHDRGNYQERDHQNKNACR